MRLLFVSGTSTGGSTRSTLALAEALHREGISVEVVLRDKSRPRTEHLHKRLVDLRERPPGGATQAFAGHTARLLGRRRRSMPSLFLHSLAGLPENAVRAGLRSNPPDAVVASSISRTGWRDLRDQAHCAGVAAVLYLREANAIGHLTVSQAPPDLLLANAQSHVDAARAAGHAAVLIPSLVDVSATAVESTRRVAFLVNPRPEHGVETALALARARPDIPFVLQESWLLDAEEKALVTAAVHELDNVEFRPFVHDNTRLYRDARVLVLPHLLDNRPRVVLEAQANGIPVLGSRWPGIVEAAGAGGLLVEPAAPAHTWLAALAQMWDDVGTYERLRGAARAHAVRDEVAPDRVVRDFLAAINGVCARRR